MANSNNDEKKGFGPALAAMILAIVAFVITGIIALVFTGMKDMMTEILTETISTELGTGVATTAEEFAVLDAFKFGMKFAFGAIYFSGGLFMLISFICDIVAICKYYGNKSETKAASTIVLAYIGLAFLVAAILIAVLGAIDFAGVVDKVMAPYYG
ncbi:MAG: hypothetical protein IJ308_03185 [Clostridia bacterium]|nr:hypothetical protein [Clostridia bacterium]